MQNTEIVRPKIEDEISTHYSKLSEDMKICFDLLRLFLQDCKVMDMRDLRTLVVRLRYEGVSFITITLPTLAKNLLNYLESGADQPYPGFKLTKHKHPAFLKSVFAAAYDDKDHNHVDAIRVIYMFSSMFSKLRGPYNVKLLSTQLNDFITVDESLPEIVPDRTLFFAKKVISRIFRKEDVLNIIPRPGPGATNVPLPFAERFRPNQIFDQVDAFYRTGEYFYSNWYGEHSSISELTNLYKRKKSAQTARFKFVPKKANKARGICIEYNDVQYLQQGLSQKIREMIAADPDASRSIHFEVQDYNAAEALRSSKDRVYATLDMKEASDRISIDLVKYLFRDLPLMSDALCALSTREITFDKAYEGCERASLKCKKFAPMGSALCFPIMAVVHYALIKSIIYTNKLPHADCLVYGDDIIVHKSVVPYLYEWFPKYGLKFNVDKSFTRCGFRESCGLHAYNGVEITPIYIKYIPQSFKLSPKIFKSIQENEYDFERKGFASVSSYIRRVVGSLPFVAPISPCVGYKRIGAPFTPFTKRTKTRYNQDYQRFEYKVKVIVPVNEKDVYDDFIRKYDRCCGPPAHNESKLIKRLARKLGAWTVQDRYLASLLLGLRKWKDMDDWSFEKNLKYKHEWY